MKINPNRQRLTAANRHNCSAAIFPTGDLHTHTLYSDGFGSIADNISAAEKVGLESLAITDHGPSAYTAGIWRADTLFDIAREVEKHNTSTDIRVLSGVEANITGYDGEIDVPSDVYRHLDILAVGFHPWAHGAPRFSGNKQRTHCVLKCLEEHPIDLLTHPGLDMEVDIEAVIRQAMDCEVALEISARHTVQIREFIEKAAATDVKFWCCSDAHRPEDVGKMGPALDLINDLGISTERICNVALKPSRGGAFN